MNAEQPEGDVENSREQFLKPLFWISGSRKNLQDFPDDVKNIVGFALWQAQIGEKHIDAKPLKGFQGAGVLEIVEDYDGNTYRCVYTVRFSRIVYALHAFQKKAKKGIKTPKHEIDLVEKRLKLAKQHYQRWQIAQQKRDQP